MTAPTSARPGAPNAHHPTLRPDDPADQRTRAQVHPPDWVNPAPASGYHLVVIGAGTGGLVTAAAAAGLGARVALVERSLMGGDCLNVGCVPSKSVIRAARAWHEARAAAGRFGGPRTAGDGDFAAAMGRLREVRAGFAPIDGAPRFAGLGVDVFLGQARFVAPDAVEVDGDRGRARLHFRRAVVAAGARAAVPDVPGLAGSPYYTNETIFSLDRRPAHLVVLGGGPIGCELAQAFARLGTRVTVLDRGARLLAREEPDASAVVERAMARDGVDVWHGAELRRVEARGGMSSVLHVRRDGAEHAVEADALLVAVGRAPNVDGLGLAAAGVAHDPVRGVTVDDRLRTSNPRVYAVGDVCSPPGSPHKFTHAADFQARLVVQNALFFGRGRASALVTPWVTYTSPEVARVGLTEAEAREQGVAVDVVTVELADVDRAVIDGEAEGFCRVLLARGTDRIVGCTLVGAHAGETIGEVTLAMTAKVGLAAIGRTMHPYPTQAEALRKAADQWRRRKLTPRVRRLFGAYFRALR